MDVPPLAPSSRPTARNATLDSVIRYSLSLFSDASSLWGTRWSGEGCRLLVLVHRVQKTYVASLLVGYCVVVTAQLSR